MGNVSQVSSFTQENFDINRYMGEWQEIAHIPQRFQQGCQNASAIYKLIGNQIDVLNICSKEGNPVDVVRGIGTIPDPNVPSKLKIKFIGFINTEGDYWVHYTDYDKYAIVGNGTPDYLWILSRSPVISICDYKDLVLKSKNLGYNTDKLVVDTGSLGQC